MEFETWMNEVDSLLESYLGLVSDDLPDQTYRDWFDVGLEKEQVVQEILSELNTGGWL